MIVLVTGPPGSGKSAYSVRALGQALANGKYAATNVPLSADWAERVANVNPVRRLLPALRRKRADELRRRVVISEDLGELFRIRLRGKGEGRGVMVLDEAHNWLNARSWSSEDRGDIVRFFTQHRKLGWDVYLVTQDADMLDKQVRALFEYHVHLRNLRKYKVLGLPLSPVNLFLAVWQWHSAKGVIVRRECYRLGWWRHLYSTFSTSHGLEEVDDQALWLPLEPDAGQPAPATDPVADDDDQAPDVAAQIDQWGRAA